MYNNNYEDFIKYRDTLKTNCVPLPKNMHIDFFIEIMDWCIDTFGFSNFVFDENCFWFIHKNDAVMFRIRWLCD